MTNQTHQLIQIGGRKWQEGSMIRVYFNNWHDLAGLEVKRFKSGKVDQATLNGEPITKREARNMLAAKVYYDVNAGKFETKDLSAALSEAVITALETKIAEASAFKPQKEQ